ncbi:hypothetical protein ACS0TY_010040 [Phlomoides rotata]
MNSNSRSSDYQLEIQRSIHRASKIEFGIHQTSQKLAKLAKSKTKGQRSANHVWRNRQDFIYTDLQRDRNIDDEVHEQHVDPQDEAINEQHVDPPERSDIDDEVHEQHVDPQDEAINEQHVDPPAKTKGQRSVNHVWRNRQDSIYTDLQRDRNIDDETKGQRSANHVWRNRQDSIYTDLQRDQNIDDEVHGQHVDPQDKVFEQPKVRGYTYMPHIWAISSKQSNIQPLKIEFNKYGQPIGRNKSKYVEFLGTIVRNGNLAPLNFKDWHKVPASLKKDMLDKVKGSYVVPIGYDKFVLQALGKSWRAFKCRIKTKYFNSKATMEQNLRMRPDNRDDMVKEEQWKSLIEYWCSEESKKTSEKNKENRALKKMQHITGKRSFAQVYEMTKEEGLSNVGIEENDINDEESGISDLTRAEIFSKCYSRDGNTSNHEVANALEKMQKLKSQLPPGARDGGLNDIYSQVLGKDKGGRVRMYGYGVTTKDVYGGHSLGQDDIHHIAMEKERLEKELEESS